MPPLTSSAIAPVSTGSALFVYYQTGSDIFEATSHNGGSSWEVNSNAIAKGVRSWGSPFTAYYNKQDADYGDKETIHLLYVNAENKLIEQFKYASETKWETIPSDVIANHEPTDTSRVCSGAVLIGPVAYHQVKHQFVYYETYDGKTINFTEIWRAPRSPFNIQTVLPGKANQQPGSDLAVAVRSDYLRLFYQDRARDIKVWENITGWTDKGVLISATEVSPQTPIAATTPSLTSNKDSHIAFVGSGQTVKHHVYSGSDGKTIDTGVRFYPGSHIGLVSHDENVLLFYLDVYGGGALKTKKYHASTGWVDGARVVA